LKTKLANGRPLRADRAEHLADDAEGEHTPAAASFVRIQPNKQSWKAKCNTRYDRAQSYDYDYQDNDQSDYFILA